MMSDYRAEVKLEGGPEQTVSWLRITSDGALEVEFYDFSDFANERLGRDAALFIGVAAETVPKLSSLLDIHSTEDADATLLQAMRERFNSYFAVQDWLIANRVKFKKWHDPWP